MQHRPDYLRARTSDRLKESRVHVSHIGLCTGTGQSIGHPPARAQRHITFVTETSGQHQNVSHVGILTTEGVQAGAHTVTTGTEEPVEDLTERITRGQERGTARRWRDRILTSRDALGEIFDGLF